MLLLLPFVPTVLGLAILSPFKDLLLPVVEGTLPTSAHNASIFDIFKRACFLRALMGKPDQV
jgi:hypothetical protein